MKVLLIGDYADDPRLGSSKVHHELAAGLRTQGHACTSLLGADLGPRPRSGRARWALGPALAWRAARGSVAAEGPFDVIDAASAEGAWIGLARRAGGFRGTALVARTHGLEHLNYARLLDDARAGLADKPWPRRLLYPATRLSQVALAVRLADRLLAPAPRDADEVVARGWKLAAEVDVVPHGLSPVFLDAGPDDAPRGAGLLFCGSWDPVKGVQDLVAAFDALVGRGLDLTLTVLGPGLPAPQVLDAFPARARPRVRVVDRAPEAEVAAAYRRHDVLLFPSTYEGYGMVVPEAMSQGLPVVATPVGCVPRLVKDGDNGIVVPPRDPRALAAAVERLHADPGLRARLGAAARRAVTGLSWTSTVAQTVACYERAVARVRAS